MLKTAAEAESILASDTDSIDHPFWTSKTEFLEDYPVFGEDQHMEDDDKEIDLMALVVLDDFPVEVSTPRNLDTRARAPS